MNQGIVIDVGENISYVLSEGKYLKVKNKGPMAVGMEILFTEDDLIRTRSKVVSINFRRYASIAAVLMLVVMMSLFYYNTNLAVFAVVTMDINPSLEISLNRQNQVLSIDALNEDGYLLLNAEVLGLPIDQALVILVDEAKKDGFTKEGEETFVVVTAVSLRGNRELRLREIEGLVADQVESNDMLAEVTVAVIEATEEDLLQSKEENQSLPLVALRNKNRAKDVEKVADLGQDPEMLEEIAQEGNLYNRKYGNAIENRNDLIILDSKIAAVTRDADLNHDLQEVLDAYDAAVADGSDPKEIKNLGKEILKALQTEHEDQADETNDEDQEKADITDTESVTDTEDISETEKEEEDLGPPEDKTNNGNGPPEDKTNNGNGPPQDKTNQGQGNEKKDSDAEAPESVTEPTADEAREDEAETETETDKADDVEETEDEKKEEKTNNGNSEDKTNNGNSEEKTNNGKNK